MSEQPEPTLRRVRTPRPARVVPPPSHEQENLELMRQILVLLKQKAEQEGSPARPYLSKLKSTRFQAVLGIGLTAAAGYLEGAVSGEQALLGIALVAVAYITGKSAEHIAQVWAGVQPPKK